MMIRRPDVLVTVGMLALLGFFAPDASGQVTEKLPNLVAHPAEYLSIVPDPTTGAPSLIFAAISSNRGAGPMEIVGGPTGPGGQDVYQRVYLSNGASYDRLAGTFEFHPEHHHVHMEGYALYTLRPVAAPGASQQQSQKTSFCLMDTTAVNLTLPGAPQQAVYTTCSADVQGISVGWGDWYGPTLPGQSFDLSNSPNGDYDLQIDFDPQQRLLESNESDNRSCVRIRMNILNSTVSILGACTQSSLNISSITPNSLRSGSSVNVVIKGSGFAPGMAVGFENGSGPAPIARNVVVVDPNTITATVSVKSGGAPRTRYWDLRVSSAILQRGFAIVP
jgi:hypothetical protein